MPAQYTTAPVVCIKDIRRNKAEKTWDAYVTWLDTGLTVYVGSEDRHFDAERLCDSYVYDQLRFQAAA